MRLVIRCLLGLTLLSSLLPALLRRFPDRRPLVHCAGAGKALPRFGNAGPNIIVGPGTNYMDANLAKVFLLGERRNITIRFEAFNLLNHANYADPSLNLSNTSTVATITSVLRPNREVQFAARFAF